MIKKLQKFLLVSGLILSIALAAALTRSHWLPQFGLMLISDDHPAKNADAVILLMGDVAERTPHAADLMKEGFAPAIIFAESESGPLVDLGYEMSDAKITADYLGRLGVDISKLTRIENPVNSSTIEEATTILKHLEHLNPKPQRVILVTSWYHSSRAKWIFERVNQKRFTIESSPAYGKISRPEIWWKSERPFLAVFSEYLKWTYYLLNY